MGITCFPSDKFKGLDFSDRERYKRAWEAFEKVLEYNRAATAAYEAGLAPYFKYVYASYEEQQLVLFGQQLHVKAYPDDNWSMDLFNIALSS